MELWSTGTPLEEVALQMNSTENAILKQIQRMRSDGIPLERRTKGHTFKRLRGGAPWTQEEVEYLFRRRLNGATAEEISLDLGRSYNSVNSMIQKLRAEGAPVAMRGNGVRRLWNTELLKGAAVGRFDPQEIGTAEKLDQEILLSIGITSTNKGES